MCRPSSSKVPKALTFGDKPTLSESELNSLNAQLQFYFSIERWINRLTDKLEKESNPSESDVNLLLLFMRLYFSVEDRLIKTVAKFMREGKL